MTYRLLILTAIITGFALAHQVPARADAMDDEPANMTQPADDDMDMAEPADNGDMPRDAAAPAEAAPSPQQLQTETNAYILINKVIGDSRQDALTKSELLARYFAQTDLNADFSKSDIAKEPPPADMPLTFDDAVVMATEYVRQHPSAGSATPLGNDIDKLTRIRDSYRDLARKGWNEFGPAAHDAAKREAYLHETGKFEEFLAWVDQEMAERDKAEQEKAEAIKDERQRREYELQKLKDQQERDRQARMDQLQKQHEEAMQREWDRRMQAYQLETDRMSARNEYKSWRYYRYYDDRYYRNRRYYNSFRGYKFGWSGSSDSTHRPRQ